MTDPRAITPEFAEWPPIGWGCTMSWKPRLAAWRRRPRKERINYPGDRVRRNIRPVPIGRHLMWSPGGCATREMEQSIALGYGQRKLLARGFWRVDGAHVLEYIKNIDFWFDRREVEIRARAKFELETLSVIRAKALDVAGAIDRLAVLGCEETP